ncbi:MAG TPA: TonB-dependent receptor, partial [Acidobacteriaceae bacterium]|nr:TonB-dependent receptor [Acidobacteriaceae bacterium]
MTLRNKRIRQQVLLAGFLAVGSAASFAQGIITGTLTGEVEDPTGAKLPNATVTATNIGTGVVTQGKVDGAGSFTFPTLPVGQYKLVITSAGFDRLEVGNIMIDANKTVSLGAEKLATGAATEKVEVSASANLLETTQSQITSTFDSQEITDLPTGGGLDRLALLVPGVVRTLGDNFSNSNGVGFSANGQRGRSNNFEIDGQANNDNSVTGPQVFFRNEDAVQEIQIVTNSFSAQYGRNAGSIVNYITRSGTNTFHGTGFFNWTGSWGSSLTQGQKGPQFGFCAPGASLIAGTTSACTPVPKPRYVGNEWGGSFGGPILKDKLFGFGSTLFRKTINGASPSLSSTLFPTPTGLQQLQAAFPGNPFVTSLVNQGPYSVTAGNPVPASTSNVTVCALNVTTCPAGSPSIQFGTVKRNLLSYGTDQEDLGRLDYQATQRDRFFLRYFYELNPTFVSGGTISTGTFYDTFDKAHSVGADWTHIFGPRWVNQLRYGFQQTNLTFGGDAYPTCTTTNLGSCPSSVTISGYAGYGFATNIPQGRIVKTTQVQDNVSWNIGRHGITFGGEYDYQNSPNTFLPYTSGGYTFTGFNQGLAGVGTLNLANGNPNIPFTESDYALYFQDDWKATDQLTLNLGLRWEFFGQSENLLHNITVARQTGPNPIWNTSLPLSLTTLPELPNNYKNFQPRIGFAYNPAFDKDLVVRGGFAINFDPQFYNIFLNVYSSAPVVNTSVINCNGTTVNCLPAGGTTNTLVNAQNAPFAQTGVNPGTKSQTNVGNPFTNPYAENFNLGVQHQVTRFAVAEAKYVGNHSLKNFQSLNSNPNIASNPFTSPTSYQTLAQAFPARFPASLGCTTAGAVGFGRLDCNRTYETTRANTAFSIYNALQTSITMRELKGLSGVVTYTWSRTVDNASETYSSSAGGNTIAVAQNPFDTNYGERAVSGQSYPNVVAAGLTYKLHIFESQKGIVGRLLGGYETNLIWTYNSGQPYTPYQNYSASPNAAALAKIPTANQGAARYSFCDYYYNTGVLGAD